MYCRILCSTKYSYLKYREEKPKVKKKMKEQKVREFHQGGTCKRGERKADLFGHLRRWKTPKGRRCVLSISKI